MFRVSFGVVSLCVVAGFIYERFVEVSSSSAVLTGVDVVLRAPIDGVVSSGGTAVSGSLAEAGQKIIQLTNDRVDMRRLNELTGAAHTVWGEVSAIRMRIGHAIAETGRTSTSSEHFQQARLEQLRAKSGEADAEIRSAEARLREARSGLERSETLLAARSGTAVLVEQYQRMRDVAEADLVSARQRKAQRNLEMEATEKGVFHHRCCQ